MNDYPDDWKEIANRVKEEAGWRCVRCKHPHSTPKNLVPCDDICDRKYHDDDERQRVLTVHHLDGDKANCAWWNLVPLCQGCHLNIQARVDLRRQWPFEHSNWFKPYVAGYYAHVYLTAKKEWAKEEVLENMEEILALERVL